MTSIFLSLGVTGSHNKHRGVEPAPIVSIAGCDLFMIAAQQNQNQIILRCLLRRRESPKETGQFQGFNRTECSPIFFQTLMS
jgi:hypothetical protein